MVTEAAQFVDCVACGRDRSREPLPLVHDEARDRRLEMLGFQRRIRCELVDHRLRKREVCLRITYCARLHQEGQVVDETPHRMIGIAKG